MRFSFPLFLGIFVLLFLLPTLSYATNVTACSTISSSDTYTLNTSLFSTGGCISIQANDTVFSCQGNTITGDRGNSDIGINITSSRFNVTVRDCFIQSFGVGIQLGDINSSFILNNTLYNHSSRGMTFLGPNLYHNNITNNTFMEINGSSIWAALTTTDIANLTIERNILFNSSSTANVIRVEGSNSSIRFNTIYNFSDTAINIGYFNFVNISNNTIFNGSTSAIVISSGANNTAIDGNVVYRLTDGTGILLGTRDNTIRNNRVENLSTSATVNGIGTASGGVNNTFISNTILGAANGFYIQDPNNSIISNTVFNNTIDGIALGGSDSSNTNVSHNIVYNNTGIGISIASNANNTVVYNNTVYANVGNGINVSARNATVTSNTVYRNAIGIDISAVNLNVSHNFVYNNSGVGINLNTGANSTLVNNNTIYNNSGDGISIGSRDNIIQNNRAENNSVGGAGIFISSFNNSISSNTLINNLDFGIIVFDENNTITSNTIYSNYLGGIFIYQTNPFGLASAFRTNISSNTIYNHTRNLGAGIIIGYGANLQNVSSNTIENSTYGILYNFTNGTQAVSNMVQGNSYGIYLNNSKLQNLSDNNVTNSSVAQYQLISGSNATFTGTNYASQTPSGAVDLNVTGGSILTGTGYNLTTDHMTVAFTTMENITLKTSFLAGTGASETLCASSAFSTCRLASELMEFNNLSGPGRIIDLVTYYNFSKITGGITETDVYLGKWSAGWNQIGRTSQDTTAHSVTYNSITSFSFWGAVGFVGASSSGCTDCGDTSSNDPLSLSLDLQGNIATITATSNGAAVSGATIKLIYNPSGAAIGQAVTDADGKVTFTLTQEGTYRTRTTPPSGYDDPEELEFSYSIPSEEEEEVVPEPEQLIVEPPAPPAPTVQPTPSTVVEPPSPMLNVSNLSVEETPVLPVTEAEEEQASILTLENIGKGILLLILIALVILGIIYYLRRRQENSE